MPRRRPAALRADRPGPWRYRESRAHLPGIAGSVVADIIRLERRDNRLSPGAIHQALRRWIALVRGPAEDLLTDFSCPCGCAPDPWGDHREVLEIALRSLPPRAARELRGVVDAADQLFLRRTLPDPWADLGKPWWLRRL